MVFGLKVTLLIQGIKLFFFIFIGFIFFLFEAIVILLFVALLLYFTCLVTLFYFFSGYVFREGCGVGLRQRL